MASGSIDDSKETQAEWEAARQVWERAKKIIAERPFRRRKNSRSPEIWQFREVEKMAKRLYEQSATLARELGIESDISP